MHDFQTENRKGKKGEIRLLKKYPFLLFKPCIGWDVIDTRVIKTVEIKTDFFDMYKTPNFFMERFSNDITNKPGGPWRSMVYGADVFLYQFWDSESIFLFHDVIELVRILDTYIAQNNLEISIVPNPTYNTKGFKIPRKVLAPLYKEIKLGEYLPEG